MFLDIEAIKYDNIFLREQAKNLHSALNIFNVLNSYWKIQTDLHELCKTTRDYCIATTRASLWFMLIYAQLRS